MSSTTLPVCPKTGSTSPSLTVHLCLHTAPGNRECALQLPPASPPPERLIGPPTKKSRTRLEFGANKYGPYADQLRHLLDAMDGSYLHCERRLADAGPKDLIRFDDERRDEVTRYLTEPWATAYRSPLNETSELIDGFESPLGMELLATVDWLIAAAGCEATTPRLRQGLAQWPTSRTAARRKQKLFSDEMLSVAIDRLNERGLTGIQPSV